MLENLTITQLNAMTKEQLIAEITAGRTVTECTQSTGSEDGQTKQVFVTKDLAGALIKTEQWDWTYKDGVVDEITKIVLDSKAVLIESFKIVTVDGVLKAVPMDLKEILPIGEKLPVEEVAK